MTTQLRAFCVAAAAVSALAMNAEVADAAEIKVTLRTR
jgi:hypothetical protein